MLMTNSSINRGILSRWVVVVFLMVTLGACGGCAERTRTNPRPVTRQALPPGTVLRGDASWYGPGFAGKLTANGETYDPRGLTAAHQSLPFNTWLRITNRESGDSVVVRVNDHFPGTRGRAIDLSEGAFERIAPLSRGVIPVEIVVLPGAPEGGTR
jgi:rare lipoprotein A